MALGPEPMIRDPWALPRRRMVERLKKQGIAHPRVLAAMSVVPRERFLAEGLRGRAYEDERLPIGEGQTMSLPWTVARMSELLEAPAGTRVLEIGAGSGYQAAVLGKMDLIVFAVERFASLARAASQTLKELGYLAVTVKHFDGTYGWSAQAPFAGILVSAAAPQIPAALLEQLRDGGRLVLPLVRGEEQRLVVITKRGQKVSEEDHGPASFVPLVGRFGFPRTDGG